jgi:hypothetical protein
MVRIAEAAAYRETLALPLSRFARQLSLVAVQPSQHDAGSQ